MCLKWKGSMGFGNCDVSFFFGSDFGFPYRGVVSNILGHLDKFIFGVVTQSHSFIRDLVRVSL